MGTVLTSLNSTLTNLRSEVEMHQSIVSDACGYVKSTKTCLDEAQAELDQLVSAEKEKRNEHDDFGKFLNKEPDRGTPAMRATLETLNDELNDLVLQLGPAREKLNKFQKNHDAALGALDFNEKRLKQKQEESVEVAERIKKLATNNN